MSIVLAFSGGLDTSFCVPYLKENHDAEVYTVTVDTGGLTKRTALEVEKKALSLGAKGHFTIDGRADLFTNHLSYLIKGNVLRGGVYPLCVGPERVVQASHVVSIARHIGAEAVAHGSTGAGNDQVRFDVAFRLLADDLEIFAPIRDLGLDRAETAGYLKKRGFDVPEKKTAYSINAGLWGTTVGGKETLTTDGVLPDEAYPSTGDADVPPRAPEALTLMFDEGIPTAVNGQRMEPVSLIESLNVLGGSFGIGRDVHVGDTILGIKGRVGFEAPAAVILITAHRELEKIVLTKWQRFQKDHLADFYGMLLHEGQHFDPVMRDIEALIDSSQQRVSGMVNMKLSQRKATVSGCSSPYSLFDTGVATYGETNSLWDGRDAQGFARIAGVSAYLAARAEKAPSTD